MRATVGKKKMVCKITEKNASKKNNSSSTEEPSPSPSPAPSEEANEQDVAALEALIQTQKERGAEVSEDIGSKEYYWENGRLKMIFWVSKKLSGDINLSGLSGLERISVSGNRLTSLDISQNHNLKDLYCEENLLEELDVTKNTALESLDCGYNSIRQLNVSQNYNLKYLSCGDNL